MATTPEAKVKARIHAALKSYGAWAANYIGGTYANNGVADILACPKGRFFAIEAKAGTNKPTALQIKSLMAVDASGGVALVINEANLQYLKDSLNNPWLAQSNYKEFITPAVREALGLKQ